MSILSSSAFKGDFRRRNLAVLGIAALISVLLAIFALWQRAQEGAPRYTPTEFLPGFAAQVKNAARIHVVSHTATFDITYTPEKGWVLPDRGNYPADFDQVRHTLIGLAALETVEPKTARPDWLHYIALDTPPQGTGTEITVSDAQGHVLASLIAGSLEDIGDPNGATGLFVRRPGEDQSYLARSVFAPQGEVGGWLMQHVMDIALTRLHDVTIAQTGATAYTMTRNAPSDQDFKLTPAPKPGFAANSYALNILPGAFTGFTFNDVRPDGAIDFSKPAAHVVAHSFDGLTITLDMVVLDKKFWVKVAATGSEGIAARDAAAINARTMGWTYQLTPDKGALLMTPYQSLVREAPPAGAGMPPMGGG